MTPKEVLLVIMVIVGFGMTFISFTNRGAFDCFQNTTSSSSSCSIKGGKCISSIDKRSFTSILGTTDQAEPSVSVKCTMFGCSVKINNPSEDHEHAFQ